MFQLPGAGAEVEIFEFQLIRKNDFKIAIILAEK
jgi:hypothetical protein